MIRLTAPTSINNTIDLPGSKSLTNRWLIIKHLYHPDIKLKNASDSSDSDLLRNALGKIKNTDRASLDIGDAGTDMRFLSALLSVTKGEWTLTGSERMKQRPIGELVRALNDLGAEISFANADGYPPLHIKGKTFEGGSVSLSGSISSQFISAILLIGGKLKNGIKLLIKGDQVSVPYISMTIVTLQEAGLIISHESSEISVENKMPAPALKEIMIESDWSAASYWYSICALCPEANIRLGTLRNNSSQGDAILAQLFRHLGVKTSFSEGHVILSKIPFEKTGLQLNLKHSPDLAQTIAVTCFALGVPVSLSGLETLRIKETDRIMALKTELEKLGAKVDAGIDSISIIGCFQPANLPRLINTYGDHRMAMSFAPLAFLEPGLMIEDENVVSKSYPAFWEHLISVGFNVNSQTL